MGTRTGLLDLETHFAFYGAYYSNRVNILIHILFMWPPLHFTFLVFFHFTPSLYNLPSEFNNHGFVFNFGFLLTLIYALFYVCLDKKAGSLAALICVLCWLGASFLANGLGFSLSWKFVLAVQCLGGTGQLIGHGKFEKRAPALMDNFAQALLMGPYFVLLEVLQSVFGYEPYPGFNASVKEKMETDIKE